MIGPFPAADPTTETLWTDTDRQFVQGMETVWQGHPDLYDRLNALRDYVNANLPEFELYLEDVWNDHQWGETWFEYILRSLRTKDETPPLGYDIYKNHQDAKGVWHLDNYIESHATIDHPKQLMPFILANRNK